MNQKETNLLDLPKPILNIILFETNVLHPIEMIIMTTLCKKLYTCVNHKNQIKLKQIRRFKIQDYFHSACQLHYLNVAEWLFKTYTNKISIVRDFDDACRKTDITLAKFLYKIAFDIVYVHYYDDERFQIACDKQNLEFAKWLWKVYKDNINIHAKEEAVFVNACQKGNLKLAKWLWKISKHKINIRAQNFAAYEIALLNGHFHVADWLLEL